MRVFKTWGLGVLCIALAACGGGGGGGGAVQPDNGNGASEPTVLAGGLSFQSAGGTGTGGTTSKLASDATHLYWFDYDGTLGTTGGSIRRVAQAGGAVTTLVTGLGGVNDIAVDGNHLYWTGFAVGSGVGSVNRVPLAGGAVEVVAAAQFFPVGLALDGTNVYWGENSGPGSIFSRTKAAGSPTPVVTGTAMDPLLGSNFSIAVDATTLYWTEGSRVRAIVLAGGVPQVLASGLSNIVCLSQDADTLFFMALQVPRILYRLPKAGGVAVVVEADGGTNMVSDGTTLYWTRNDAQFGSQIVSRAKAGGAETVLGFGGGLGALASIVVVGGQVYMLDVSGNQTGLGRILRL